MKEIKTKKSFLTLLITTCLILATTTFVTNIPAEGESCLNNLNTTFLSNAEEPMEVQATRLVDEELTTALENWTLEEVNTFLEDLEDDQGEDEDDQGEDEDDQGEDEDDQGEDGDLEFNPGSLSADQTFTAMVSYGFIPEGSRDLEAYRELYNDPLIGDVSLSRTWQVLKQYEFIPSKLSQSDFRKLGRIGLIIRGIEHPVPPPPTSVMNYNFSFSEPEITELSINGTIYHRVNMEGLPIEGAVGVPLLPVKPLNILLPQAYVLDSITVTWEDNISLGEEFNIELGTEPVIPGYQNISNVSSNFDPTIPYPIDLFLNVGTYDFRGYNILTFVLYPIHYIGETGELYYYENLDVTVTAVDTGEVSPFFRAIQEDEMMIEADDDILDIYNMTSTYVVSENTLGCFDIVNLSESYDYVIITNNDLKNAQGEYTFQTLRDFKNNRGTSTKIVTVEDIYANYNGDDELEKIRNFIKDAYWGWRTKYVLLGGDDDIIPARRFAWLSYEPGEPECQPIPSDIYYACLNGNFNFDGDEHYGEIGDLNDYRAEVYIGRACVNTDEEVSIFVNKTMTYVNTEDEYLEDVAMVGEFLFQGDTVEINGHNIIIPDLYGGDYLDQLIDVSWATGYRTDGIPSDTYTIDKLYDRDWPGFDPDNSSETGWPKAEIINRINSNIHIINHLGHGNNFHCMKLDEPVIMRDSEILGDSHDVMDNLTNDKHFFLYSQACLSGAFDNKTVRAMWGPGEEPEFDVPYDCIAEYLTVKTDHGAFAVIANTRYGLAAPNLSGIQPWGPSQHFNRQFWDAVFGEGQHCHRLRELGPANQDSKEDNIFRLVNPANTLVYYELTLFGDPQIVIKDPEDFEPEWIVPDGHNDIEDAWDNEPLAYDKDTTTKAGCTITDSYWNDWVWTPWLELTLSTPITCDKIRFYAWYSLLHCNEIEYYIYGYNSTHHRSGYFDNHEWVIDDIPGGPRINIYKAKVRFNVRRGLWPQVTADLHEFQFHQIA